jgi:hypothetical protein
VRHGSHPASVRKN